MIGHESNSGVRYIAEKAAVIRKGVKASELVGVNEGKRR